MSKVNLLLEFALDRVIEAQKLVGEEGKDDVFDDLQQIQMAIEETKQKYATTH